MKLIRAEWSAPQTVHALTTTRLDGVSEGVFAGLNLGDHVGDDAQAVQENRARLLSALGLATAPQWLTQIHGTDIVKAQSDGIVRTADACWTEQTGQACIVMTADCLPVLFCNEAGTQVAAAHAGWRGLCNGMLEQTLNTFDDPSRVIAWLGPAIGPLAFEVGGEVREQFIQQQAEAEAAFTPSPTQPASENKWLADLYELARLRLKRAGVKQVTGGNYCTFTEQEYFYSYRRDGQTGRMASLIWIEPESR